jgi:hypothetical protein
MSTTNLILASIAILAVAAYAWLAWDEIDTLRDKAYALADWFAGRVPSTGAHGLRDDHVSALTIIARVNPARVVQR